MDFLAFCRDYNIEVAEEGHHHVSKGWVGVHCPFCAGSRNFHLGYNSTSRAFSCWRCGSHSAREVVQRLTGQEPEPILAHYSKGGGEARRPLRKRKRRKEPTKKSLVLPDGFLEPKLRESHRRYLRARGFGPSFLVREWGLSSTSPTAQLDKTTYRNRIFIPIHWEGTIVSFQARAISDAAAKYKACTAEFETVPARTIVYRHPLAISPLGICVEGPTDVWRIGRHAFAPLGIGYSEAQVNTIAKLYTKIMLVFDPEPLAQQRAKKLSNQLRELGVDSWVHRLEGDMDPGSLPEQQAQELVTQLFTRP